MRRTSFGIAPGGEPVYQYTLAGGGLECQVITFGGALRALRVPDREGKMVDVVLGFDDPEHYFGPRNKSLGLLIGRYCNHIGGAGFDLNGVHYPLAANDGPNNLHSGPLGFHRQPWRVEAAGEDFLTLSLTSPDGQSGFPGTLTARVTYRLEGGGLTLSYWARSDRDTLCSLTNHAYFNLAGHDSGPVLDQQIQIFSDFFTPTGPGSIPTGEIAPVEGTPMDLRRPTEIGAHIGEDHPQLRIGRGYDHNWVVPGPPGTLRPAARAYSPRTGISLEVLTTQPGVQFYTANYLGDSPPGKGGAPYGQRWGFCLETQAFPDSPHHPNFPSAVLRAEEEYRHTTIFRFRTE